MKALLLFLIFMSSTAFSITIDEYRFDDFVGRLCKQKFCIDRGHDRVMVSGGDRSVKITKESFDTVKTNLVSNGINPDEKDVLGMTQYEYMKFERKIMTLGKILCGKPADVFCGGTAILGTLHWGIRAAGLMCLLTSESCQEYYKEKVAMLDASIKKIDDENARIAEGHIGSDGGLVPGEEAPTGTSWGGGGSVECRRLPAYTITAEGQSWDYPAETVCKPAGGW